MDGRGNADLLPAFLNSDNFTPALHFDGACRIGSMGCPGEKDRSVSKNTPDVLKSRVMPLPPGSLTGILPW
jgi:hypothetical protein